MISWLDDSLLDTCSFILIYCLLTAKVVSKSPRQPLWAQNKHHFPLKSCYCCCNTGQTHCLRFCRMWKNDFKLKTYRYVSKWNIDLFVYFNFSKNLCWELILSQNVKKNVKKHSHFSQDCRNICFVNSVFSVGNPSLCLIDITYKISYM